MKASVYIATSLDGFIARANGDLDWLPEPVGPGGDDYGYGAFMKNVDVIVMGRGTYEKVLTLGSWPYEVPVVVLSSRNPTLTRSAAASIETMSGPPSEILARLESRGLEHAYVDGGVTIRRFLEAGLIQRLIITRVPVLIGSGIPLFGPLVRDVKLHHVNSRAWVNGLVQSEYEVVA